MLLLISVSLFVSSWVPVSQGIPLQAPDHLEGGKAIKQPDVTEETLITNGGQFRTSWQAGTVDGMREELPEDMDFEDDDGYGKLISGNVEPNVNSVRHFHEKKGEILIPCFGMWWPVGGPTYDYYGGDYYGGGGKKRRSRKQKKAAKMKKKKS